MKIEVGKTYLTRDKRKAFVYLIENDFIFYKIAEEKKTYTILENNNGIRFLEKEHFSDLVLEYFDPRLKKCIDALKDISSVTQRDENERGFNVERLVCRASETLKEIGEIK